MSALADTIRIIISAEDQASATIEGIGRSISGMADGAGAVTAPLAGIADKILAVDAAALALAVTMSVKAADAAQTYSQSFGEIATLIELPLESLGKFKDGILEYAQGSTQGLDQITRAIYDAISAGTSWENAIEQVAAAERLAIAGKADLADANTVLLKTTAAYAESNLSTADAANKLFTVVKTGVVTLPQLSQSLGGVVDIAAKGGVSVDALFAAIATLTKTMEPAEAITSLKGVITAIISPSAQASAAAEQLGLDFSASGMKANDLDGMLRKITEATGGSADEMTTLFGNIRGLSGVLGLATNDGESFTRNLEAQRKTSNEVADAVAKMAGSLDTGASAVQVFMVRFGQPFEQQWYDLKAAVTEFWNALADQSGAGAFSELQTIVANAMAGLQSAFVTATQNLPKALEGIDWSGFLDSLDVLSGSFGDLFGGVDLTSVDGLETAMQALVDTAETLVRVTSGIVDSLKPFIAGLAEIVTQVNSSDEATKQWAGEILGLAKGINTILPAVSSLGDGIAALGAGLGALGVGSALSALTGLSGAAGGTAAALGSAAAKTGLVGAAGAAGYALGTVLSVGIDGALSKITGSQTSLGSWLYDVTHASEDLSVAAPSAATALRDTGAAAGDAAAGFDRIVTPIEELRNKQHELITASDLMGDAMLDGVIKTAKLADSTGALVKVYDQSGGAIEKTKLATGQLVNVLRDGEGNITGYSQAVASTADKLDKTTEATKKAKDETDAYRIKIAEIDAQLQKATLEAFVSIETTKLETDAERVKATFASLDTTITSTGDLLGSLFGNLNDAGSLRDKFAIEDQIDLENKRRQESLDLQKELATAEIERVKAQTEALTRGDALIQIDGAGLEPELEAFMWQILKNIRVRANAEFSDYLLGMSVA